MTTRKRLDDGRFVHRTDTARDKVQSGWIRVRVSRRADSKRYWVTMTIQEYQARVQLGSRSSA